MSSFDLVGGTRSPGGRSGGCAIEFVAFVESIAFDPSLRLHPLGNVDDNDDDNDDDDEYDNNDYGGEQPRV